MLSQPYDTGWRAYYGTVDWWRSGTTSPINDSYHLVVNGFANGWITTHTGDFYVTLSYQPQAVFYVGSAISVMSLFTIAIFAVFSPAGLKAASPRSFVKLLRRKLAASHRPPLLGSCLGLCQRKVRSGPALEIQRTEFDHFPYTLREVGDPKGTPQ